MPAWLPIWGLVIDSVLVIPGTSDAVHDAESLHWDLHGVVR